MSDSRKPVTLKVVPEPEPGSAVVVVQENGVKGPIFKGESLAPSMECGGCGKALVDGAYRQDVYKALHPDGPLIFRCGDCETFNAV